MSSTRLSELEELVWRDMLYQFPYLYTTIRASIDDFGSDAVLYQFPYLYSTIRASIDYFGSDAVKRHINLYWKDKLT